VSLAESPCWGGVELTGSDTGAIFFTNDNPPQWLSDFAEGDRGQYANGVNCFWQIECPSGQRPSITFSEFSTEENFDFVNVYDGTSTDDLLETFHGNVLPNILSQVSAMPAATGQHMLVHFTSDYSVTMDGFNAQYSCSNRRRLASSDDLTNSSLIATVQSLQHRPLLQLTRRASDTQPRELPDGFAANTSQDQADGLHFGSRRRRLERAGALAPRVIPDDFVSTATAPPPAPPPVLISTTPPPPPVVLNITSEPLAPASALGLGGFTARCDSKEEVCEDEDMKFMYVSRKHLINATPLADGHEL